MSVCLEGTPERVLISLTRFIPSVDPDGKRLQSVEAVDVVEKAVDVAYKAVDVAWIAAEVGHVL
jgi:hypothetical protein